MAVKEMHAEDVKFRGHLSSGRWTLCIGAGVSRGIVPTWLELTRRLVNETFGTTYSEAEFSTEVANLSWSLDAWIQACANHFVLSKKSHSDFFDLIEKHIYSDLRFAAKKKGLENVIVSVLDHPQKASREQVAAVCNFFESEYPTSSLLVTAKFLLAAEKFHRLPDAVITFNADTLLHSLIELFQRHYHYQGPPPYSHPKYLFKPVLRPIDSHKDKVPIYHCHGAIKPKASAFLPRDSRDRLVFLESEYIKVATTSSSWAETLFMFHAQTTHMLFVGFSMSDPNMRRWLALSNESSLRDVQALASGAEVTPRHIWITPAPAVKEQKLLLNEGLFHLGVRPGWISNWNSLKSAYENLLAIN